MSCFLYGVPRNVGNLSQNPCLCLVGGFGILLRSEVAAEVEPALHGVAGVASVDAPGSVPNICFATFDSPEWMRDFVGKQKQNQNIGPSNLWLASRKSPFHRQMQAILGKIYKDFREALGRSGKSIVIDRPSKQRMLMREVDV